MLESILVKLLFFSDLHGDLATLARLLDIDADYYIACGDLCTWARGFDATGAVLQRRGSRVHVLPGNHESEADIEHMCRKFGLQPFHGRVIEANGWKIAGLGYSNPTPFDTPGEYSEEEIAERLSAFAGLSPLILACHCPPRGTPLDQIPSGRHLGSESIRRFIDKQQPKWFFCGHIHEAEGVEAQLGATRAVNVGKRGYLLEVDKIQA